MKIDSVEKPGIPPGFSGSGSGSTSLSFSSTLKGSSVLDEPIWVSSPIHVLFTFHVPDMSGLTVIVYSPYEVVDEFCSP